MLGLPVQTCYWYVPSLVVPLQECKPLYLEYAKLEESHGLARHAMDIYARALAAVPRDERKAVLDVYVSRASDFFGIAKVGGAKGGKRGVRCMAWRSLPAPGGALRCAWGLKAVVWHCWPGAAVLSGRAGLFGMGVTQQGAVFSASWDVEGGRSARSNKG